MSFKYKVDYLHEVTGTNKDLQLRTYKLGKTYWIDIYRMFDGRKFYEGSRQSLTRVDFEKRLEEVAYNYGAKL